MTQLIFPLTLACTRVQNCFLFISVVYKKEPESDRSNYRPISWHSSIYGDK